MIVLRYLDRFHFPHLHIHGVTFTHVGVGENHFVDGVGIQLRDGVGRRKSMRNRMGRNGIVWKNGGWERLRR